MRGKGGKVVLIPLPPAAARAIERAIVPAAGVAGGDSDAVDRLGLGNIPVLLEHAGQHLLVVPAAAGPLPIDGDGLLDPALIGQPLGAVEWVVGRSVVLDLGMTPGRFCRS
ncbi:hypothetical protein [Dactylosporangium sp. CA-233914]|uniref:hypothetical protein n=1 Tax=Dactylosporangium sp. CA-233914 TaxID=3239934 RepID=UPI003D8A8C91